MKQCVACPQLMSWRDRHKRCQKCRQAGSYIAARVRDDYPLHIIEARYIRAVWASNPAKAQRLLAQMRAAA